MMNTRILTLLVLALGLPWACSHPVSDDDPLIDFDVLMDAGPDVDPGDVTPEDDAKQDSLWTWSTPALAWPTAFLSVAGSAEHIWIVGAQHDSKPAALRRREGTWQQLNIDHKVDLWWVSTTLQDGVYIGGSQGSVFHVHGDEVQRMDTPGLARQTVFGVWAGSATEVYAVGGIGARSGFVWRFDGGSWEALPLPADMPRLANGATAGLFKVWGDGSGTVWFVGAAGTVLRRVGEGPLERIEVPTGDTLLAVHGGVGRVFAVGGLSRGIIVELGETPRVMELDNAPALQGIGVGLDGSAYAVGGLGAVYALNDEDSWDLIDPGFDLFVESLHAAWVAPDGALWAVGGNVISPSLDEGVILHGGPQGIDALALPTPSPEPEPFICPRDLIALGADRSIPRRWIEQNLAAIRRDIPRPGVHARNLHHLSLALFDAWAAYDDAQTGVMYQGSAGPDSDIEAAREETMSYAAYRVLHHRYAQGIGGAPSTTCFRALMEDLGYNPDDRDSENFDAPGRARALGNHIGSLIVDAFASDGALEHLDYHDPDYVSPSVPLIVDEPGVDAQDPQIWQPLDLARAVTQNGIPIDAGPQGYIGPHWGQVAPFAIARPEAGAPYVETPTFPFLWEELTPMVVDVIKRTGWLDTGDPTPMDISPGRYGNTPLGADLGDGHPINPYTNAPYEPNIVPRSDFGRVLAEYWADGPDSETPPGHWNTIANAVVLSPEFDQRLFATGELVDNMTYDVHMYLLLNGALHDAAIVAWEQKRLTESARPITLIRWMAQMGQSTQPLLPSYHPMGLPLVDGLIELVTQESAQPGARHAHLAAHVGEVAIFSWPGAPGDYRHQVSPGTWIRAVEWSPYQPETFVSPAFPGYISGHSTFSRAAAEVLTSLTGSPYFPGGLGEFAARAGAYLEFERGPSVDVRLQWATYYDAADQAGQSRIWGGIHIIIDDLDGRRAGAWVGHQTLAWAEANLVRGR